MASANDSGVVYTKRWVVDFMLDEIGFASGNGLLSKRIVEPSCGTGAFLAGIADRLCDEVELLSATWSSIESSVAAYDIDPVSVECSRSVVISRLTDRGCPKDLASSIAQSWVREGDFLLDEIAGGCDFVIGNPPYVRASEIGERRSDYVRALSTMSSGCDIYVGFFERGLSILRQGGSLCYICADRWMQNKYGKGLRELVGTSYDLRAVVRMYGVDAFEEQVDAYPSITVIGSSDPSPDFIFALCDEKFGEADAVELRTAIDSDVPSSTPAFETCRLDKPSPGDLYPLCSPAKARFVTWAMESLPTIEESGATIGIGIATGCNSVFITDREGLVEENRMLPMFIMRDHRRGRPDKERWLVNPWSDSGELVDLDSYPRLRDYYERNRTALTRRHIAKKNPDRWYRTIDKVKPGLVDRDILLMPDMASSPDPVLSRGKYPCHNSYWISSDNWDLRVLGGLLMADTTRDFIDALGVKMRGGTLRFEAQYLRLLRVPPYETIGGHLRDDLRRAFDTGDRDLATSAARAAYGFE